MPSLKLVQVILLCSKWCPPPAINASFRKRIFLRAIPGKARDKFSACFISCQINYIYIKCKDSFYGPQSTVICASWHVLYFTEWHSRHSHICFMQSEGETNPAFVDFNSLLTVSQFTVLLKEFWHATTDPFSLLAFKISCNSIMPNADKYVQWGTNTTILPQDDVV